MNKLACLVLIVTIVIGVLARFLALDEIPSDINPDEASLGYNSYSLLKTGKDEYGKFMPVFFRSFGNFQSPLYVYLSIPFVYLFDLSVFSTRFISALSGSILILITYFFILNNWKYKKQKIALIAALILAISPWSIFFSRMALEANLGLTLFSLGVLLSLASLEKPKFLVLSSIVLAASTYAYHSERVVASLYLFGFLFIFRKALLIKKIILISMLLFFLLQVPQLSLINTPAFNRRITDVNYFKHEVFTKEGGKFKNYFGGKSMFITYEFVSRYISYFSPKNLFSSLDPRLSGTMPNQSLFYPWMVIPFILGGMKIFQNMNTPFFKVAILLALISPIPAAVTKETFYTLRALPILWIFSAVIGIGCGEILKKIPNVFLSISRYILLGLIMLASCFTFYITYAVMYKYEYADNYPYIQLVKLTQENAGFTYFVDSARNTSLYMLFAFFRKEDPKVIQDQERSKQALKGYYTDINIDDNSINFDNVITNLDWKISPCTEGFIVGDILAVSNAQELEHNLTRKKIINYINGRPALTVFSTNPREKGCI